EMDGLEPGAARCHDTLDRFLRRVLDCLGVEFAKNANFANRDSQHARQRTKPEGTNEDKRKNKCLECADHVETPANSEAQKRRTVDVFGTQKRKRQRKRSA